MAKVRPETIESLRDDEIILTHILHAYVLNENVKKELDTRPIKRTIFKDFLRKVIFDSDRPYHNLGTPVIWGSDVFEFITGDRKWFCNRLKEWLKCYTYDDPNLILEANRCVKVLETRILQTVEDASLGRTFHIEDVYDLTTQLKNAVYGRTKDKLVRRVIMNFSLSNIESAVNNIRSNYDLKTKINKTIDQLKEREDEPNGKEKK